MEKEEAERLKGKRREEETFPRGDAWVREEHKAEGGKQEKQMRSWKSMEYLRPGAAVAVEIDFEERVSRDVESMLQSRPKLQVQSSKRFFDLDVEKKRMQKWNEEQEKKRQVQQSMAS